jgi:septal ring factor EnvC (AmiA/AmiB activator)
MDRSIIHCIGPRCENEDLIAGLQSQLSEATSKLEERDRFIKNAEATREWATEEIKSLASRLDRYKWTPEAYDFLMGRVKELESERETLTSRLNSAFQAWQVLTSFNDEPTRLKAHQKMVDALVNARAVETGDNIPAEPRDMTNVTGLTERERYGIDQLDAPGGPRAPMCGAMFPPGQFAVQQCTLPKGHAGEHEHKSIGL